MYHVYGSSRTRGIRLIWLLEELGQPYEHTPCMPQSPEVRAVSAAGKVPVMKIEGETITDSLAIMTYLADKHGLSAPAGSLARAHQDAVTFKILDEIETPLWTAAKHTFALPEKLRQPEIKTTLRAEFKRSSAALGKHLTGQWIMGDTFTANDVLLGHCLDWAINAKFELGHENFGPYHDRLRERAAYQRARAKP